MPFQVQFRKVIPRKLSVAGMVAQMVQAGVKDAQNMVRDLDKTTKTWKGEKARFNSQIAVTPAWNPLASSFPNRITTTVSLMEDSSRGAMKWKFLEGGTRVRYAIMSKNFRAKTRLRELNSWAGAGGALLTKSGKVVLAMKYPRPGIKARKWLPTLKTKYRPRIKTSYERALRNAVKASGHSVR